ncbi:MAG: glycosyltransferase, partial [Candidatus Rokuibacteriota bacterium]
ERGPNVIPPALPDETPVGPERADAARRESGLDGAFVLYPGDYEFSGGHDLLLRVWRRSADLPQLVLSGREKTPAAAERRRELITRVERLGLSDRVRFLGRVPDLAGLQAAAEALLFPADSLYAKTDLPLVILEAWRDGVAVLVSDLAPLREAIADGGAVLPRTEDAWMQALQDLPARRRVLAEAGAERFRKWYSAERAASSYLAVYRSTCDDSVPETESGTSLEP